MVQGVQIAEAAKLVDDTIAAYKQAPYGEYMCIGEFMKRTERLDGLWNIRGVLYACIHALDAYLLTVASF